MLRNFIFVSLVLRYLAVALLFVDCPLTNVQIASISNDAKSATNPKGQVQAQAQDQNAMPTKIVSSVKSTVQAQTVTAASVTAQLQATGSVVANAKANTTQGSGQTSSASSLKVPWCLSIWKRFQLRTLRKDSWWDMLLR